MGLDSRIGLYPRSVSDTPIKGHFWPMAYRIAYSAGIGSTTSPETQNLAAYFTVMDQFLNDVDRTTTSGGVTTATITNYTRIGPFGLEIQRQYFRRDVRFQDTIHDGDTSTPSGEYSKPQPNKAGVNNTHWSGYFGLRSRLGSSDGQSVTAPAIGLQTWNTSPIINVSDGNYKVRSRGSM